MVYWYTTCSDTPISSMPRYCRKNFIGKMPLFTSLLRPHDECKPRALAGCESIPLWLYGIQPCNTSTFKKKGLQWLLHVPTKRNLKVVAATMIHCAQFAELLTSHPVPLSPSSTVNWSRGECHVNMRSKVNYILQKQFAPVKVCGEYTICHHNRTAFRLPPPGTACVLCSLYTGLKFSQAVSRSSPKTETSGYLFGLKITRPWQVTEYD